MKKIPAKSRKINVCIGLYSKGIKIKYKLQDWLIIEWPSGGQFTKRPLGDPRGQQKRDEFQAKNYLRGRLL